MNILCATDLLPKSEAAVNRAHLLRTATAARLTLLHVVAPGEAGDGTLEQRLLSANSRLAMRARHSSAPVELVVRCGRPAAVIRDVAQARRSRLLVVGPHEGDALADAVLGTLTERLVARAGSPVLIVRRDPHDEYRRVLLALDGSEATRRVVEAAESLALPADATLTALHAHEPPYEAMMTSVGLGNDSVADYASASLSLAAARIREQLRARSRFAQRYRLLLADAPPVAAIRRAVLETAPDLLVLGTRGHGRFRRALLGSTAIEALARTECDVLLVPDVDPVAAASQRAPARAQHHQPGDPGPGAA